MHTLKFENLRLYDFTKNFATGAVFDIHLNRLIQVIMSIWNRNTAHIVLKFFPCGVGWFIWTLLKYIIDSLLIAPVSVYKFGWHF